MKQITALQQTATCCHINKMTCSQPPRKVPDARKLSPCSVRPCSNRPGFNTSGIRLSVGGTQVIPDTVGVLFIVISHSISKTGQNYCIVSFLYWCVY